MELLKGLNTAQRAAVTSRASVLQVLAPPGSGKTKTLTTRVAYLLQNGYKPQHVICCTFTIKAAREMRERLRGLVGGDLESKLVLGTFHSICRRYLMAYGHLIGIPKNFGIADSSDSLGIIKRLKKKLDFTMDPKTARTKISHRKARGETIEVLLQNKKRSVEAQEFLTIFQEYENALATSSLLDYDDLLLRCVELLRKHPSCVSNVEALLIDEFQDTNVVQFELMKLLASAKSHVTIVGDPDQSIYGFRSAEIANLKRMQDHYSGTVVINLEENYRSTSAILNLAQEVIEQDEDRPSKRLKSTHCYGTLPVLRKVYNPYEEAAWIVSEIKRMTKMTGGCINYSDIAILLRSSFLSLLVEKALVNSAIPYKMVGGRRFFERVEVRLILDYMRTISHPDNNSAFLSIINTPSRRIGEATIAELASAAERSKVSLWTIVQKFVAGEAALNKNPSKVAAQGLNDLAMLIRKGQAKLKTFEAKDAPGKLIEFIVKEIKFLEYLKTASDLKEDWEDRWENVRELTIQAHDTALLPTQDDEALPEIDGLKQSQVDGPQEALSRFLANVALATEMQADEEDVAKSRLTISTIHAAKGLEWPVVFIPAVYTGSIPHSRAEDTNEERRLLYVAMTRAKALLYMTFPVMQSRSESESILTEFLPATLENLMNSKGPSFSDRVVQDLTTVLHRPPPSQEDLTKGLTSLESNESAEDDLWPIDGTQRPLAGFSDGRRNSFGSGRTLAEAVSISTTYDQKSNFSTMSGFTTAGDHLSRHPPAPEPLREQPRKLVKSSSGQGSIANFLQKGSFKKEEKENVPPPNLVGAKSLSTIVKGTETPMTSIPPELNRAKLGAAFMPPLPAFKRSHSTLQTTTTNTAAAKRSYSCFSSSPTREAAEQDSTFKHESQAGGQSSKYTTSVAAVQRRNNIGQNNYASGMLNTLSRPQSLSMAGSGAIPVKRTLGVKRSMNGWDSRKHK